MALRGMSRASLPSVRVPPATSFKRRLSELWSSLNLLYPTLTSPSLLFGEGCTTVVPPLLRTLRLTEANQSLRKDPCKSGLYVGRHAQTIAVPSSMLHNVVVKEIVETKISVSST